MVFLSCKNALDIPCLRPLPSPLRLVRERHGACGVLPTGHGHALAGSGSPYDAPSAPQAIPCQLCFRGPLLFLVENVLKLLPPLPISLPVLLPERQLLARRRECAAASFAGFLSGKPPLPVPVDLFAARPQHVDAVAWRQVAFVKPSGYLVCRASCRRVHL